MASLPYPRRHQTIFPQKATQPNHLWASVKSVEGSSTPEISVNSVNSVGGLAEGGVGMAGMPYPPNLCPSVKSVGEYLAPETSVNSVNSVGGLAEGGVGMAGMPYPPNLCASVKSVGEYLASETSVNSVISVGEPYAAKPSVCICAICGRIIKWAAWVWQGCHTLLSVFWGRTRTPWGENTKRAWRNAMPSYVSYVDAWVWQGCHTLL